MNSKYALKLSADVLRALYAARDERITLDDLCEKVGANETPARDGVRLRAARREDVREIVRRLDEEGFVDALRMKLTLQGFTLAASLTTRRLVPMYLVA
jgi:ribosomal protein S19E (S16A)